MELDSDERRRLIWEAKDRGDVAYLTDAARRDVDFRDVAAQFLGEVGDASAIGTLVELLRDANPQVRAAAVRSLGRLEAREASPTLFILARDDPVFYVRDWSMQALAEIGEPDVVPLALDALGDEDVRIRRSAAIVLGRVGSPDALDPLRRAKKRDHLLRRALYRDASSQIRSAARRAGLSSNSRSMSLTRFGSSDLLGKAASAGAVMLVAFLFWLALGWIGAPAWVRLIGTVFAILVWLRYLFIRMRHRSRRSRLHLRDISESNPSTGVRK